MKGGTVSRDRTTASIPGTGPRVFGLAGWSGSGKTHVMARVIPTLVGRGLRVSTLKHAHHRFDIDHPGKDSHTHREAGATEVLISSAHRFALLHELRDEAEPTLPGLLGRLAPVDIVLVEGFKHDPIPKLEIYRPSVGKAPLWRADDWIVAVASDEALTDCTKPVLPLDDIEAIADLILAAAGAYPIAGGS
jgi:molybdopterin-guanine dinucleotide biosynthesis protein B